MNNNSSETPFIHDTKSYMRWHHPSWVVPEVIGIFLIIVTIWILFSIVYYGIRVGKWRKTKFGNVEKLNGGVVYSTVVVCAVITLLRYFASQIEMNLGIGEGKDNECRLISETSLIMYALTVLAVYVFMWLRQFIFYQNNMLKTPFNKFLKYVSAGSIILLFLSGLGTIIGLLSSRDFFSSWNGCKYKPVNKSSDTIILLVCAANFIISQLILLALFIYPLQKSRSLAAKTSPSRCFPLSASAKETKTQTDSSLTNISKIYTSRSANSSPKSQTNASSKRSTRTPRKTTRLVRRIMKRTIIFAAISMITDLVCLAVSFYVIPQNDSRRIATVIYDLNAFLNLIFVIGSFLHWKIMLISPFYQPQSNRENSLITSNAFVQGV